MILHFLGEFGKYKVKTKWLTSASENIKSPWFAKWKDENLENSKARVYKQWNEQKYYTGYNKIQ